MSTLTRQSARTTWVALRSMALLTILLGVVYTVTITLIGQLLLPAQANGSLVRDDDGQVAGSALIGQNFADADGAPLPEYFQPRPSAAGDGYDGGASSGSNYGPENEELIAMITERRTQISRFNGVAESAVPADAVTASSSGLDPHISPEYAAIQVARIADARSLSVTDVRTLLDAHTRGREFGFLGSPTVNVLELNVALDSARG
ncbi:K(+)-transporting ATPase subunit C [Microbacterium esteraromaticum]|uniref:K(+)-transporting ATPase subunit C n=1 Tax=Microbacterium esteraromaticum TaxID=57043 RepID=UPI00195E2FC8|nr:K(+)-transporting ATPase subunit C [Microbacterium esteraromaticum]MBM7466095.1 K+-transporting ATPase ATPase C chain [Microbacterium esteraromaticum]